MFDTPMEMNTEDCNEQGTRVQWSQMPLFKKLYIFIRGYIWNHLSFPRFAHLPPHSRSKMFYYRNAICIRSRENRNPRSDVDWKLFTIFRSRCRLCFPWNLFSICGILTCIDEDQTLSQRPSVITRSLMYQMKD